MRPEEQEALWREDVDPDGVTIRVRIAAPELTTGRAGRGPVGLLRTDLRRYFAWYGEEGPDGLRSAKSRLRVFVCTAPFAGAGLRRREPRLSTSWRRELNSPLEPRNQRNLAPSQGDWPAEMGAKENLGLTAAAVTDRSATPYPPGALRRVHRSVSRWPEPKDAVVPSTP
ncbi:hypothetical protein GCM10027028_40370 [Streptomyces sundarbansensis]